MENEFECLVGGGGRGGHLAEGFLRDIVPSQSCRGCRVTIWLSLLGDSWQWV